MKKLILITAGGTGGHVFPALSIAKQLQPDYDILWVGASSGIENNIVPKNNLSLATISISGLRKKGLIKMAVMPFILIRAFSQCLKLIISKRPDVIVGFGGYATFPICFIGSLCRIPVIIHEQNSVPGLSNKLLAKFATHVLVAYDNVLKTAKTILVGNPVRDDIVVLPAPNLRYGSRNGGLNILIVGGSLGAKVFNDTLPEIAAGLDNLGQIVHQVGRGDVEAVKAHYTRLGVLNVHVTSFIEDMAKCYAEADLIICRSGASTVSEVCNVGIAAIFIPYPYAVDDHQRFNVQTLVECGAAYMMLQSIFSVNKMVKLINSLDRKKCQNMANLGYAMAINDSVQRIVDTIKKCIK